MSATASRNTPQPLILTSVAFFGVAFFAVRFPEAPGAELASFPATFAIALPAVWGLFKFLGASRASLSLLTLAAFAYSIETIGVVTGLPYGAFYYGESLGPKLMGFAPYLLPVTYLPLVVGAVAAAWGTGSRVLHVILAALLLTLIDGVLDPGATALGFWVWPGGGPYYGVPLGNYLGWLLSGALAAVTTLFVGRWKEPPLPIMLDSAIIAVAFWTGVATFSLLPVPALLGAGLFAYLVQRRSRLAAAESSETSGSGTGRYKLQNG